MTVLHIARRLVLGCTRVMAIVAMVVIGLMMLTITYDVIARFAFAAPTDWAYPINSAGVLAATSLAIPHLYATGQHISMDLVHRALSPRLRRAGDVITAAATALLGLVLAVTGYRSMAIAITGGLNGSGTFNIPLWIPDAVLLVTGVFLVLVAVLFAPSGPVDDAIVEPSAVDREVSPAQSGASA